jgi:hypothetical protein
MQLDKLLEKNRSLRSGIFELWASVTLDALRTLRNQGAYMGQALSWIKDPENEFFNMVCEGMGYEPSTLRKRILKELGFS